MPVKRPRAAIVSQGIWDMPLLSMPLSAGYLKATALADPDIAHELQVEIQNFRGGVKTTGIASALLSDPPDVLAFSAFGWNFRRFGLIADAYKAMRPNGLVIFGGTHVTDQGERVFRLHPSIDVVVNGEGEFTFRELLRHFAASPSSRDFSKIAGISYRTQAGTLVTTPDRGRIEDLDEIPSPFLSGALPMTDSRGSFLYDAGLMETNRGCPFQCSFCFWGGAVRQKVRKFSSERLREEVEFLAHHGVRDIFLCDANFGMLPSDIEFMEDVIRIREKYGHPYRVEPSWGKNKSKIFYQIVRRMRQAGMRSSFTLALQSLDKETLRLAKRTNMKVNDWSDMVDWLVSEGLDVYAELIWGLPGETYESFLQGYDRVAERFSRIATYSTIVIPNTDLWEKREELGITMILGDEDDFGHVMATNTVTLEENQQAHRFLFWARAIPEHMYFRHIYAPLRVLAGIPQSQILLSMNEWLDHSERRDNPAIAKLHAARETIVNALDSGQVYDGLKTLYLADGVEQFFQSWWDNKIMPRVPEQYREFFEELFRYDWTTRPHFERRHDKASMTLPIVELAGDRYFVRTDVQFKYDIRRLAEKMWRSLDVEITPNPQNLTLYYKVGFWRQVNNHEVVRDYVGKTAEQIFEELKPKKIVEKPLPGEERARDRKRLPLT